MEVEVTIKLVYNVDLNNYKGVATNIQEAVAYDFDHGIGLPEILEFTSQCFLIDVQPYVGEKNEVALEAELMSKTLGLDNG